jgi:Polyketide cyclase / dehydrase and lipid transport
MPKISKRFVITAPASAVWKVIGPGYASIGEWATAIPASTALPHEPPTPPGQALRRLTAPDLVAAPVAGRVCSTGLAIVPELTEALIAYDDTHRSLTYEAAGMPSFVATARNTWTVTPLDSDTCVVTLDAQLDTRGILGTLARWVLLAQLGRTSRHLGDDLRHFVENGSPSPRKQRQLLRAGRAR